MTDMMNEIMIELLELLQDVDAKMKRVHEIKAKYDSMKKDKPIKSNTVTCSCGCTVVFSSLKRHQKTKKHMQLLDKTPDFQKAKAELEQEKPIIDQQQKPVDIPYPFIKQVKKTDIDEDDKNDYYVEITDKLLKHTKEQFYKGMYVKNYQHQQYLEKSLTHNIHEMLDNHSRLPFRDMVKIWHKKMCKSLDEHLETYLIEDIATEKKVFIDHICKNTKNKCNTPLIYSLNNIKKFETTLGQKLYNDYADMKNRGENHLLIKDFVCQNLKELLNEHVCKYGYNENGIKEYLTLKNEV